MNDLLLSTNKTSVCYKNKKWILMTTCFVPRIKHLCVTRIKNEFLWGQKRKKNILCVSTNKSSVCFTCYEEMNSYENRNGKITACFSPRTENLYEVKVLFLHEEYRLDACVDAENIRLLVALLNGESMKRFVSFNFDACNDAENTRRIFSLLTM